MLMRELNGISSTCCHLDMLHLVPRIDEAAVDEEAGFGPALDERLDLALDILLMLDGQQLEGFAADQEGAQLRDEQDLRVLPFTRIGIVGHAYLLLVSINLGWRRDGKRCAGMICGCRNEGWVILDTDFDALVGGPGLPALSRLLAAVCLSFTIAFGHLALQAQDEKKDEAKAEHKDDKQTPVPPESAAVTHHEWKAAGTPVAYTATAGNLVIHDDDDKPYGSVFYVAYTEDGVSEEGTRPITFLYNGGPGSATIWLHMGSVGPMRVVTASPEATGSAPYKLVPNEYSLLGKTDLVFIDAVGTGFSKPVGKATEKDFAGTDQDVKAFQRFIERYITLNKRWNSPKYLMGESYGTTRSAALADALQEKGIELNGVVLVSSILNYGVRVPGYDTESLVYLPSYAAIAWFHNKLAQKPADLKSFLDEVRRYASGPYAEALAQGDTLLPAEKDAVAQKLSAYTGLSADYLKQTNLRINPSRFRKELLRGEREVLGRYDARFEGTDIDAAGETPGYDPSDTGIAGAFIAAFHDYCRTI